MFMIIIVMITMIIIIIIIIQVWTLGRPIFYSLLPQFPSQITLGPSWTLD